MGEAWYALRPLFLGLSSLWLGTGRRVTRTRDHVTKPSLHQTKVKGISGVTWLGMVLSLAGRFCSRSGLCKQSAQCLRVGFKVSLRHCCSISWVGAPTLGPASAWAVLEVLSPTTVPFPMQPWKSQVLFPSIHYSGADYISTLSVFRTAE